MINQEEKIQVVKNLKLDLDTKIEIITDICGAKDFFNEDNSKKPLTSIEFRGKWGDLIADVYRVEESTYNKK